MQLLTGLRQVAMDGGSWEVASLLLPARDPCQREQWGASERELEAVASYRKAMKEIGRSSWTRSLGAVCARRLDGEGRRQGQGDGQGQEQGDGRQGEGRRDGGQLRGLVRPARMAVASPSNGHCTSRSMSSDSASVVCEPCSVTPDVGRCSKEAAPEPRRHAARARQTVEGGGVRVLIDTVRDDMPRVR